MLHEGLSTYTLLLQTLLPKNASGDLGRRRVGGDRCRRLPLGSPTGKEKAAPREAARRLGIYCWIAPRHTAVPAPGKPAPGKRKAQLAMVVGHGRAAARSQVPGAFGSG